jgi:hypothetical protein
MTQQWIGQQFVTRSTHPEEAGRTVRVLRQKKPAASLSFVVANVAHPRPELIGRETTMSAKTLIGSSWRPVESSGDGEAPDSLDELLARIHAEHDQQDPEEHTGCHTQVLLAGIRAALAVCDQSSTESIAPATVRTAIAAGIRGAS